MTDRVSRPSGDGGARLARSKPERLSADGPFDAEALSLAEQSAGVGIWSIDLAADQVRGTPQFFRNMGLEATDRSIPMEAIRTLRHPADREHVVSGFQKALEGGDDAYEMEYRIIRPDGETRWIFGRGRVIRNADGHPVRSSGIDLDITERKALEASLRGSDERLRLAIEAGQLGIWDWDIPTNRVTWSDRVYELHGVPPGGFGGRLEDFAALVHPQDVAGVRESIERALHGDAPYEIEFRVPLPDGRIRWLATRAHLVRDDRGQPMRMVGATYDATEKIALLEAERLARANAEASRRQLELLSAAGAELANSLEPRETLQAIARLVVPAVADWCRVDLVDSDGVLQRAVAHHVDPEKARWGMELVQRLRAAPDTPGSMGWAVKTGQSRLCHFDPPLAFDAIRDRDLLTFAEAIGMRAYFIVPLIARGRTLGALAALQAESGRGFDAATCDLISELARRAALALDNSQLHRQTETALEQAKSANLAKDEFLAVLGHELRNPLAPIALAVHLLEQKDEPSGRNERQIITRQLQHLTRLLDDVHDVARIAKGKIRLQCEKVDLRSVVDRAVEITRPLFERRTQALEVVLPSKPVHVWGDPVRLTQVICNLLNNSTKFSSSDGHVALKLLTAPAGAEVLIEDDGVGIAQDLLPKIFDVFVQGQQGTDRARGGLGLGLSIVKSLMLLHGGHVSARSAGVGQGSTFVLHFPVMAVGVIGEYSDGPRAVPSPVRGRILIVDDNPDITETLASALTTLGHDVRSAPDARSAMEIARAFEPELAILDIGLPTVDGLELARMLKAPADRGGLKLLAVSGYGSNADRMRSLAAGFDDHLVKPVTPEHLFDTVARLLTPDHRN